CRFSFFARRSRNFQKWCMKTATPKNIMEEDKRIIGANDMAAGQMQKVMEQLRRTAVGNGGDESDGQLLAAFLAHRGPAAFEALVQRHGRMVLGVCQRILQHAHDAEDAFQATFLVLVRKAASLVGRHTVGDWLYGVAYNIALKARAAALK